MVCEPCVRPDGLKVHLPLLSTFVVPSTVPVVMSVSVTTDLKTPVPVSDDLEVMLSIADAPVSLTRRFAKTAAVVSSVKVSDVEEPGWLATIVCVPSARPAGVNVQAPKRSALAAPMVTLLIVKVITANGSAIPISVSIDVNWSVRDDPVSVNSFALIVAIA